MRVYIRDRVGTPQGHDLQRLLRRTCNAFGIASTSICRIRSCLGYGEHIGEMASFLDGSVPIEITVDELDALVEGRDEWFYAIDVTLLDGDVRLGLHDSTVMFLEGDESGVREVAGRFAGLIWDG